MVNYVCTKCGIRFDVIVNGNGFTCKCPMCKGRMKKEVPLQNPYSLLKHEMGGNAYHAHIPV